MQGIADESERMGLSEIIDKTLILYDTAPLDHHCYASSYTPIRYQWVISLVVVLEVLHLCSYEKLSFLLTLLLSNEQHFN